MSQKVPIKRYNWVNIQKCPFIAKFFITENILRGQLWKVPFLALNAYCIAACIYAEKAKEC